MPKLINADPATQGNNSNNTPIDEPDWIRSFVDKLAGGAASPPQASTPFTDFDGLMKHLPMYGERSLRELLKKKILPTIRPPGSRKLAFHLPSIDAAMIRFQRGGIE